jgi:serpin B
MKQLTPLLAAGLLSASPLQDPSNRVPDAVRPLYDRHTDFALDLHRALTGAGAPANAFSSPLSVWAALGMLAEGAQGGTATELAQVLLGADAELDLARLRAFQSDLGARLAAAKEGCEIDVANALWGQHGFPFAPDAVAALAEHHGALLEALDFQGSPEAGRERINAWVEDHTGGHIADLLPAGSVTVMTRLVLTNAVSFLGKWDLEFDSQWTQHLPFSRPTGGTVQVPFVRDPQGRELPVAFLEASDRSQGLVAVELPYRGEQLSFLALLPTAADGLAQLEAELDAARLAQITGALSKTKVRFAMPKLELAPSYDLIPACTSPAPSTRPS